MAESKTGKAVLIEKCSFNWTLHAFNLIKTKFNNNEVGQSQEFPTTASYCKWCLQLYPNGSKDNNGFVSLYLKLLHPTVGDILAKWWVCLKNSHNAIIQEVEGTEHTFNATTKSVWGYNSICKQKDLETKIKDGILKIEVKITADLGKSEDFEIQKKNCETKLILDLETMLDNQKFCDFIIKVNGLEIPVHKCILATRSPVFSAMFEHDMSELQGGSMEVTDIDKDTMKRLIKFIYKGKMCISLSVSETQKLWQAADKYCIESWMTLCEEYLASKLELSTVVDILVWTNAHASRNLQNKAIDFLCKNTGKFLEQDIFHKLHEQCPDLLPIIMTKMNKLFSSKSYVLETFTTQ